MSKGSLYLSNRSTYQVRLVGVYSCDPRIVQVTFWKNVSGVYTADPRAVPEAFPINSMTFDEAMELAYFGGQVLHPSAMVPCIEHRIPVLVKLLAMLNVFAPEDPGTRVYGRGDAFLRWEDQDDEIDETMPVKAITSIEKVSLITIAGTSFMGTHGVAERFMEALASVGVNVILTSQALLLNSSSPCPNNRCLFKETRATLMEDLSILAVIGEGMKNYAGISGRFFNALGQSKVNIVAIAQGSSERNISAEYPRKIIVDCTDSELVASKYPEWLQRGFHIITPNRQILTAPSEQYEECFKYVGRAGGVFVLSGTMSLTFNQLNENPEIPFSKAFQLARERELAKIHSKDGSVSFEGRHTRPTPGTVQRPDRGLPRTRSPSGRTDSSRWTNWTQLCLEPRTLCSVQRRQDDLSGLDTAKKSLILARELGLQLELQDVKVESLLPQDDCEADDFTTLLKEKAHLRFVKGELLFYVGAVDLKTKSVSVGIQAFPAKNPPFALQDADFAVLLVSQRFPAETPLVFRGPGAGPDLAASGLFASLLRVCRFGTEAQIAPRQRATGPQPSETETLLLENAPSSMNAVVTGNMDEEEQTGNARLGYSGRSEKMHRFLAKDPPGCEKMPARHEHKSVIPEEFKDTGAQDLSYEQMCRSQTQGRRELIAGCFFELLVLKTNGVINLRQETLLPCLPIRVLLVRIRLPTSRSLRPGSLPNEPRVQCAGRRNRRALMPVVPHCFPRGVRGQWGGVGRAERGPPTMEWKGDEARLGQLCQLFQLASSPDNSVQQQVMQMLQQFSQLPDFNMYLATVFAKLTNQDEVVRQRAGLLLKTNVGRVPPGMLQPAVAEYVQAHALSAVRDSSKVIRHTAGTVISILVLKVGILGSRQTLDAWLGGSVRVAPVADQLAGCLGDPNANTVEGSFNALNKICEDGMMLIKQTWDHPDEQTQHFVSWSAENLLPKVIQNVPESLPPASSTSQKPKYSVRKKFFTEPAPPRWRPEENRAGLGTNSQERTENSGELGGNPEDDARSNADSVVSDFRDESAEASTAVVPMQSSSSEALGAKKKETGPELPMLHNRSTSLQSDASPGSAASASRSSQAGSNKPAEDLSVNASTAGEWVTRLAVGCLAAICR
eukprot:g14718.t1